MGQHRAGEKEQEKASQHPALDPAAEQPPQRDQPDAGEDEVVPGHPPPGRFEPPAEEVERSGEHRPEHRELGGRPSAVFQELAERLEADGAVGLHLVRLEGPEQEPAEHEEGHVQTRRERTGERRSVARRVSHAQRRTARVLGDGGGRVDPPVRHRRHRMLDELLQGGEVHVGQRLDVQTRPAGAVPAEPREQRCDGARPGHQVEHQLRLPRREGDDRPVNLPPSGGGLPVRAEPDDGRAPETRQRARRLAHQGHQLAGIGAASGGERSEEGRHARPGRPRLRSVARHARTFYQRCGPGRRPGHDAARPAWHYAPEVFAWSA